jgi:hypothetical protein
MNEPYGLEESYYINNPALTASDMCKIAAGQRDAAA